MGKHLLGRLLLILVLAACALAQAEQQQLAAAAGADADWLRGVQEQLERQEREPSLQSHDARGVAFEQPTWHMVNRATNLRSYFDGQSWLIQPRQVESATAGANNATAWSWRYSFTGLSRSTSQLKRAPQRAQTVTADPQTATLSYQRDQQVREWYTNHHKYLEQGFTLTEPPSPNAGAPVRLHGLVQTNTQLAENHLPTSKHQALNFTHQGTTVLQYSGLKVLDANGKVLTSWLEVGVAGSAAGEYQLEIVIDDAGASYPLVVDPVASSPG